MLTQAVEDQMMIIVIWMPIRNLFKAFLMVYPGGYLYLLERSKSC